MGANGILLQEETEETERAGKEGHFTTETPRARRKENKNFLTAGILNRR